MKTLLKKQLWLLSSLLVFQLISFAQGLPPGWDYTPTPTTHIVSVPLDSEPNINGWPINPGDWIGAFYIDDEGELACGGATEWLGDENTGVIAFGDDSFSSEKDGFDSGEAINWKVYSWSTNQEYDAEVTCNDGLPSPCDTFTANGLSGIATFDATGFYIVVLAEPDSLCMGDMVQLNANASGGSGTYTYSWTSNPAGFTSDLANPTVSPIVDTEYDVEVSDSGETLNNSVLVKVFPGAEVFAGDDNTICENDIVSLSGEVTNYQWFLWTTNGDGIFSDPSIEDPDYTPGPDDISNGIVMLTLTAQPIEPCTIPVVSSMQLFISGLPQVDAGTDQTICEDDFIQLASTVVNYSSLLWTTSGDGVFSDPSMAETVYTPGPNDIESGMVDLQIEANPIAPCSGSVSDIVSATINVLPVVNAGDNIFICEDEIVELSGEAENYESILWVSNGDGSFGDPTSLNSNYTPGPNDIVSGGAIISLIAQPQSPCVQVVSDNLSLTIVMIPTLSAGDDGTVCEDDTHQLNASATNFEEVVWSTSGDGVFGDINSLSTFYNPGSEDILNGEVTLTISALPQFPCAVNVDDQLTLTIANLPGINAGDDDSVCENQTIQLNGSAINYNEVLWSTSGDGNFDDPLLLNATYTPGTNDITFGSVTLTLGASPLFPCVTNVDDDMILIIELIPEVNAGDDATICEDNTHQLSGQAINSLIFQWVTEGDGNFNNTSILNPVYTPGSQDITNGDVMLSLTAVPTFPCTNIQQSDLILSIVKLSMADAGPDATVPSGESYQMEGIAENYISVLWTTSGDGTFSDDGILDPFYTPGVLDIANAGVELTLTADPFAPCVLPAWDDMILEIDTVTGITQITTSYILKTFPNPTSGKLDISLPPQLNSPWSLKVFSLSGILLEENVVNAYDRSNETRAPLDLSGYPNGVYLIQLSSDNRIWQSKVILKKD